LGSRDYGVLTFNFSGLSLYWLFSFSTFVLNYFAQLTETMTF